MEGDEAEGMFQCNQTYDRMCIRVRKEKCVVYGRIVPKKGLKKRMKRIAWTWGN